MQRALEGAVQCDFRAVGLLGQFDGPDQRGTGDRQPDQRAARQRLEHRGKPRGKFASVSPRRGEQPVVHESGEHQTEQPADLVAAEHHEGREQAGDHAPFEGRAVERPVQRPERQREPRQAEDLPGVLDAPRRRAAVGEGQRRHQPAGRAKTAIAKIQHPAEAAERQHQEGDAVGLLEVRLRRHGRQRQIERRENQALGIGDLRHAREHVGRPERRCAPMQGMGEERQLRLEMRLGVPGNRHLPRDPRPAQIEAGGAEHEDGGVENPRGFSFRRRGHQHRANGLPCRAWWRGNGCSAASAGRGCGGR